jgi:DNA uptake protein ComE-like DNA-binding protein
MKVWNKNRIFFNILLLISLAGFLVFPNVCSADDFDDINIYELEKHLELPESKVESLLHSLINIFHSEWIDLMGSGYVGAEKMAVPSIMKKAVQVQALNHLLVDAPVDVTRNIVTMAVEIVEIYINPSVGFKKLEKMTVEMAIEEGKRQLFQSEVKITPGAINFEYISQEGEFEIAPFQYVVIYKPSTINKGEILIRFYSPISLKAPESRGDPWGGVGIYTELKENLPPFVVDIQGEVENYTWVGKPSVTIDFPPEVPDLGMKPLSFVEKHLLKPIQTAFREVEIIITKATGRSLDLVDIWDEIKSFFSKINPFSPAAVVDNPKGEEPLVDETLQPLSIKKTSQGLVADSGEASPRQDEKEVDLAEIQEMIDDLAERIDVLSQKTIELAEAKLTEVSPQSDYEVELADVKKENTKVVKEEATEKQDEETEELEEQKELKKSEQIEQEQKDQEGAVLCEKTGGPTRNKIIFNEIAWMGTENSSNDEWIELKNISGGSVDLTGWQLLDKDLQIKIIFDNRHPMSITGLWLLERTDDESVPRITADLIYTGALGNTDETLYLFDENCQLQDEIITISEWPAGNNSSKRTMERKSDLNWQTSLNPGGTPKAENSSGYIVQFSSGGGGGGSISSSPPEESPEEEKNFEGCEEGQININSATKQELMAVDDVGEVRAQNIIDEREKNLFKALSDITNISGIGEGILSNFIEANFCAAQPEESEEQNQPPIASFVFSSATSTVGEEILFNAASSTDEDGTIVSYIWDFGDSATSSEIKATTTHSYSTSSDFLVSLTVIDDNNATDTTTTTVSIIESETEEIPTFDVIFNEIAWAGTKANSADEWIELYNTTNNNIDLTGWTLNASSGTPLITFSTFSISASGLFLLERSDDQTISDIPADQIYTGALKNEGEKLELRDENGILIDILDCSAGWFGGEASPNYVSMERLSLATSSTSTNWAGNNLITKNGLDSGGNKINGTPKSENSVSKSQTEIGGIVDFPVLTYLGNPYIVTSTLIIPQDEILTIEPGVTLKFEEDAGLEVNGTLEAIGEEENEIIFTTINDPNYWSSWQGITFNSSSVDSELNWTRIKFGKRSTEKARTILVDNSSITFSNSVLNNYYDRGIELINSSSTIENVRFLGRGPNPSPDVNEWFSTASIWIEGGSPVIENCDLIEENEYGIFIESLEDSNLVLIENNNFEGNKYPIYIENYNVACKNNTGQNNETNGIFVFGNLTQDFTWYKNDLPYVIREKSGITVNPGNTLTVEPGVIVKGHYQAYIKIEGRLITEGTAEGPIIFTSYRDDNYGGDTNNNGVSFCDARDWGGIIFSVESNSSSFKNITVRCGGGWPVSWSERGLIWVDNSEVNFDGLTAELGYESGICLRDSTSTIENSYFGDNEVGMVIEANEIFPQLGEGITFDNNTDYDMLISPADQWCPFLPGYLASSTTNNCE